MTTCDGQRGQALTEYLLWSAVVVSMALAFLLGAMPVVRQVPAALAGWLASVAP